MPETITTAVVITTFTLTGISTVVVALRFYCRYFLIGVVKSYDYLILAALLATWGNSVLNFYQTKFGAGVHFQDWPFFFTEPGEYNRWMHNWMLLWYLYRITYLPDLTLIKLSILIFYHSFAFRRTFRIAVYVTIGFVGLFSFLNLFITIFQCRNPADALTVKLVEAYGKTTSQCLDMVPIWMSQAVFNLITDIVILILPMPTWFRLQMRTYKRVALIGIWSVGIVVIAASSVRIYYVHLMTTELEKGFYGGLLIICSQVEVNLAIISASIPMLRPLLSRLLGPYFSTEYTHPYVHTSLDMENIQFQSAHSTPTLPSSQREILRRYSLDEDTGDLGLRSTVCSDNGQPGSPLYTK